MREALRTNLWVVPMIEVVAAVALYAGTHVIDRAAFEHRLTLPTWMIFGSADAARQILTTLAAAVITVVGVVFSITIVTLTLASTQFGPRMLRNFIRDRGTQLTLGTFVATFVYATLVLISIGPERWHEHVRPASVDQHIGGAGGGVDGCADLFHSSHRDLDPASTRDRQHRAGSVARDRKRVRSRHGGGRDGPSVAELFRRMGDGGEAVPAPTSGYLQFIRHDSLTALAAEKGAVIRLHQRPGQFVVRDYPMATVWPADAADAFRRALRRAHVCGPTRTLAQDLSFAVDQLVEIALRALSPAVNDTFTALTCVDWLGESLTNVTMNWQPRRVLRDGHGYVRVITADVQYSSLVERAFEKIRQASRGMPAVMIRQLEALTKIAECVSTPEQRLVLLAQAEMIHRSTLASVPEPHDIADVERQYEKLLDATNADNHNLPSSASRTSDPRTQPGRLLDNDQQSWTAQSVLEDR